MNSQDITRNVIEGCISIFQTYSKMENGNTTEFSDESEDFTFFVLGIYLKSLEKYEFDETAYVI